MGEGRSVKIMLPRQERLALIAMAIMDLQRAKANVERAQMPRLLHPVAEALRRAQRSYWYLCSPTRQKGKEK